MNEDFNFWELRGQTLSKIVTVDKWDVYITCESGMLIQLTHFTECCESVTIQRIIEDGTPGGIITSAEADHSADRPPWFDPSDVVDYWNCAEDKDHWTTFQIETSTGYKWKVFFLGTSNGYYGTSVEVLRVK